MSIARISPVLLPGYRWAYPELRKGCQLAVSGVRGNTGKRWFDDSGFDRHGLLINMDPVTDWVAGGLDFDGSNDQVTFPLSFAPAMPLTLAARFKAPNVSGAKGLLSVSNVFGTGFWAILTVNDDLRAQTTGDVTPDRVAEITNVIVADEWHTAVGVFQSETSRTIYVDGSSQSTTNTSNSGPVNGTDIITAGVLSTLGSNYWRAEIQLSFVGIWSRALFPSEIQLLHDRPNAMLEQCPRVFATAVAGGGASLYYHLMQGAA